MKKRPSSFSCAGVEDAGLLSSADETGDDQPRRAQVGAETQAGSVADDLGVQVDPVAQNRLGLRDGLRWRAAVADQMVANARHVGLNGPLALHDSVTDEVQPPPGALVDQDAGQ